MGCTGAGVGGWREGAHRAAQVALTRAEPQALGVQKVAEGISDVQKDLRDIEKAALKYCTGVQVAMYITSYIVFFFCLPLKHV